MQFTALEKEIRRIRSNEKRAMSVSPGGLQPSAGPSAQSPATERNRGPSFRENNFSRRTCSGVAVKIAARPPGRRTRPISAKVAGKSAKWWIDRMHKTPSKTAASNGRPGAAFSPGQDGALGAPPQHLAGRVDAVPDTAKSGQAAGSCRSADVEILPAQREGQISC